MKFTAICTRTRPTFLFTCCLLFITFRKNISRFTPFIYIRIFWAFFISLFSILRYSQLESDVCRLPESATLSLSQYWLSSRLLTLLQQTTRNIIILFQTVFLISVPLFFRECTIIHHNEKKHLYGGIITRLPLKSGQPAMAEVKIDNNIPTFLCSES